MADYSRPASGFRFKNGGMKLNAPPDAIGTDKYALLINVRETQDSTLQTRPGLAQLFTTATGQAITDIRAYSALNTDNLPRFLARSANGNIYLDNGTNLGAIGVAPDGQLGASMIPFRPSQSPVPYMYIANGVDYYKFSAPSVSNAVTKSKAGISEPQSPPKPAVVGGITSLIGPPAGNVFQPGGNAGGMAGGNRLTDTVRGLFPDPLGGNAPTTIQVSSGSTLASGVYLNDVVQTYFFSKASSPQGAYRDVYPVNPGIADAAAQGNSLLFNPPQYNGTTDPNVHPMRWATLDLSGAITGYTQPYPGDVGTSYYMVVLAQLYIPVAGNFTININHDDGMIFAISGASLVSGPVNDPYAHTKTGVNGYKWTNGTIAGTNGQGYHPETFVVNFPSPGVYSMEIDFAQFKDNQCLNVYNNNAIIKQAGASLAYQRFMTVEINGKIYPVSDVYPPLPSAIGIAGIYYYSGNTGKCTIVPNALGLVPGTQGTSLFSQTYLSGLRRGALVQVGNEVCYVEGASVGPDGTVSFDTTTVGAHTTANQLFGVPAIQVLSAVAASIGDSITSRDTTFGVTAGISTATTAASGSFVNSSFSFQDEDYIHVSIQVSDLSSINEMKLLFDVGDGTFKQNFYQYVIRPSDIEAGVQNLLTQLGVAQLVNQRATIDEERADTANNQGVTTSSAQTSAGDSQWSEIQFQISQLTRIGNDQTKSLANINHCQLLVNASGTASVAFNSITINGGYAPDVGAAGAPYQYRVRARSQATGARSNPSPVAKWSVSPRRDRVQISLPSASYDTQIDTWDIFRYGGNVTSWKLIASIPSSTSIFLDNIGDDAALAGEGLEFDNYEPWPTVDVPFSTQLLSGTVSTVGSTMKVTLPVANPNLLRYLPGNEIQLLSSGGLGHVYTLWTRPTQITANSYLFQIVENAGVSNAGIQIAEPDMARQPAPYMWGPDASGTVFAVGDQLRAGSIYIAKPNNPDSALDRTIELTPPSEPLLGGEIVDGLSYVASTERWWALYPQLSNPLQRYNPIQQPIPRGLAAPRGHCTDGKEIYFWAKDGIWSTAKGSLTDEDLYNLFPHEGVAGTSVIYDGVIISAPDYSNAGSFRLAKVGNYLFATYQDTSNLYHQLVYNVVKGSWVFDQYTPAVSAVYHPEQQSSTLISNSISLYPMAIMGNINGSVAKQLDGNSDLGANINCVIATGEWDGGDFRAGKQWGDVFVDTLPSSGITIKVMSGGIGISTPSAISSSATRIQSILSLGGGVLNRFLGIKLTWSDSFGGIPPTLTIPTQIFGWQPSFIPKQETTADRDSDWMEVRPDKAAGFVQGFRLHADTFNAVKSFLVQDSDTLALHAFTPSVQINGEGTRAYSFTVPFIAHMVRIVPQDTVPWRLFDVEWIAEATPEFAEVWQTQPTSFGIAGYSHVQQITAAYAATQPVTLTITAQDGTSPSPIILPATGGAYVKTSVMPTFNKGLLFAFKGQSAAPFQFWLDDFELLVGDWGRSGPYINYRSLGGRRGDAASI